jgi:hypothetical protein
VTVQRKLIWSIFWAFIVVLAIAVAIFFILGDLLVGEENPTLWGYVFFICVGVVLTGLGVTLLVLTAKTKMRVALKNFLLMTEASLVGFPVFVLLHNAVSGLLDMEEAVFLILAVPVCPLGFLVGIVSIIAIIINNKKHHDNRQLKT